MIVNCNIKEEFRVRVNTKSIKMGYARKCIYFNRGH